MANPQWSRALTVDLADFDECVDSTGIPVLHEFDDNLGRI